MPGNVRSGMVASGQTTAKHAAMTKNKVRSDEPCTDWLSAARLAQARGNRDLRGRTLASSKFGGRTRSKYKAVSAHHGGLASINCPPGTEQCGRQCPLRNPRRQLLVRGMAHRRQQKRASCHPVLLLSRLRRNLPWPPARSSPGK